MARHQYALQLEVLESPMALELATYVEVVTNLNWHNTMCQKKDFISKNWTWTLVDLPLGKTIISIKWIFKLKPIVYGSNFKHSIISGMWFLAKGGDRLSRYFFPYCKMGYHLHCYYSYSSQVLKSLSS
jgi:hypothetical protein